jgi:hypothetical protein
MISAEAIGLPRTIRASLLVLMLLTVARTNADAQICAGRSPFNLAPTQVELSAGVNSSGGGFGIGAGYGTDYLFGIGTLVLHKMDDADRVEMFTVAAGTDQPLSPDNKFHVCPMISAGYISGSDSAGEEGRFGFSVSGDASMLIVNSPRVRSALTIGLDFRKNVGRPASLFAQDPRLTYHTFTGGIGFLFRNQLSIVPRVVLPFGSLSHAGFQVAAVYNLPTR